MDIKRKDLATKVFNILEKEYGDVSCTLLYNTPLELLIATCLSAQCTDVRVNMVTRDLFCKYKDVYDFANADCSELEQYIKSTGLYKNKAKNIISACKTLINDFGGVVPDNMYDLLKLSGVGRKTANLILGEIFKKDAVVVDTHCIRLTNRIGILDSKDPKKIELDLKNIIDGKNQLKFCHLMVTHGRNICKARMPLCDECIINHICYKNIN